MNTSPDAFRFSPKFIGAVCVLKDSFFGQFPTRFLIVPFTVRKSVLGEDRVCLAEGQFTFSKKVLDLCSSLWYVVWLGKG